jgi:hypothetical protein
LRARGRDNKICGRTFYCRARSRELSATDFGLSVVFLYERTKLINQSMKTQIYFASCLLALSLTPVFGQQRLLSPTALVPQPQLAVRELERQRLMAGSKPPQLTRFSLDFPGGSPQQLVQAIEKQIGKPLNVIIPPEDADVQIPPLKMNDVTVPQLFQALEAASRKTVAVQAHFPGPNMYQQVTTSYGFQTGDQPVTDTSIWYFYVEKPSLPPVRSSEEKVTKFYSLAPYLDRGFSLDDITTAIQTAWKMEGLTSPQVQAALKQRGWSPPELKYHKETKLLIAYGEPSQLQTIDQVLQALPSTNYNPPDLKSIESQIQKLEHEVDLLMATPHTLPLPFRAPGVGVPRPGR